MKGGEKISIAAGVSMYVVRWNHSGDPAVNPEIVLLLISMLPEQPATALPYLVVSLRGGPGRRSTRFRTRRPPRSACRLARVQNWPEVAELKDTGERASNAPPSTTTSLPAWNTRITAPPTLPGRP